MTRPPDLAVAATGGALGGALAAAGQPGWAALTVMAGMAVGIVAADLRERRIPTALVALGAGAATIAAAVTSARDASWSPLIDLVGGAAVVGGAFLVVHLAQPRGLGFGDVRLATVAGALTAYGTGSIAFAAAAAAAGAIAVVGGTVVQRTRSAPFAPYLLGACALVLVISLR
jgi:leader peptidase (prepilin peptidase)/N-methyltransferase